MKKRGVKKNLKVGGIRGLYSESWNFLKASRNFVYISTALFFCFFIIGYFIQLPDSLLKPILDMLKELMSELEGKTLVELVWFIFFNNLKVAFIGIISGVFVGILPVFLIIANGFVPGIVARMSVDAAGVGSLWRLLPHGIFELPAIFISFGLGIKIGSFIFEKRKFDALNFYFSKSMKVFFCIILPLLIIAAIIEGVLIYLGG